MTQNPISPHHRRKETEFQVFNQEVDRITVLAYGRKVFTGPIREVAYNEGMRPSDAALLEGRVFNCEWDVLDPYSSDFYDRRMRSRKSQVVAQA